AAPAFRVGHGLTREPLIQVPKTRSAFHPSAQWNASHRRDVSQQSRSFGPCNPKLRHSPNSIRLCDVRRELPNELLKAAMEGECNRDRLEVSKMPGTNTRGGIRAVNALQTGQPLA